MREKAIRALVNQMLFQVPFFSRNGMERDTENKGLSVVKMSKLLQIGKTCSTSSPQHKLLLCFLDFEYRGLNWTVRLR